MVAICVVFVSTAAVVLKGTPVKVGEAMFAFKLSAVVTNAVVATLVLESAAVCVVAIVPVGSVGVPVKVGEAMSAFKALLPLSFCIACKILSVAATVPAPEAYPVSTLAITGALVKVVALPTDVTSPVRFALVVTVVAVPDTLPVNAPVKAVAVTVPTT